MRLNPSRAFYGVSINHPKITLGFVRRCSRDTNAERRILRTRVCLAPHILAFIASSPCIIACDNSAGARYIRNLKTRLSEFPAKAVFGNFSASEPPKAALMTTTVYRPCQFCARRANTLYSQGGREIVFGFLSIQLDTKRASEKP